MASKFQRRHYELLAKAIGTGVARDQGHSLQVVREIVDMLAEDNPHFNRWTFQSAVNASFDAETLGKGNR